MGHEVAIYGWIEGACGDAEKYGVLQELNAGVLSRLPESDSWPWLVRGIFALPAPWPQGTYRSQAIHFGMTLKDEPCSNDWRDDWLGKFEAVLRQLHWYSATAHILREIDVSETYAWTPTPGAIAMLAADPPGPTADWNRAVRALSKWKESV